MAKKSIIQHTTTDCNIAVRATPDDSTKNYLLAQYDLLLHSIPEKT